MMFTVMREMTRYQERGIRFTFKAIHRVRLPGRRKMPDLNDLRVSAIKGHVKIALSTETVSPVPPGLIPSIRKVQLEATLRGFADTATQVLGQLGHELAIRTSDESP